MDLRQPFWPCRGRVSESTEDQLFWDLDSGQRGAKTKRELWFFVIAFWFRSVGFSSPLGT